MSVCTNDSLYFAFSTLNGKRYKFRVKGKPVELFYLQIKGLLIVFQRSFRVLKMSFIGEIREFQDKKKLCKR